MESPQKDRARVACSRCNAKKTRCNATQQTPCSGCVNNGLECVLIESRRGKYPRKKRTVSGSDRASTCLPTAAESGTLLESDPHQSRANLNAETAVDLNVSTSTCDRAHSGTISPPENTPESLYAQIAESSVNADEQSRYHTGELVFLGETFSLTYVVQDVLAPFLSKAPGYQKRLHFPVTSISRQQYRKSTGSARAVGNQITLLKKHGLYHPPSQVLAEQLLNLYIDHFHPAYPIVERSLISNVSSAQQQSQLVWSAMLMIAVTLCDNETLEAAGYSSHQQARAVFYKCARCIYDNDAEPDALETIRGVFLMSFWWGGPNEMKDSKFWMGTAIILAQSQGLHRNTRTSNLDPMKASMWKRIWWCLRIRDVLISASIGRPKIAWQGDCDVDLPTAHELSQHVDSKTPDAPLYFVEMAKLCIIVARIIDARYACSSSLADSDSRLSLETALVDFVSGIPSALKYTGIDTTTRSGFWAAMLGMSYWYATVLLCRTPCTRIGQDQTSAWGNTRKAISAANDITRATEDLLSASMISVCQVHTIMALFNALAMHVYVICTSQSLPRELAEARARMCMMGLAALQESWPVGGWVLKLFDSIMNRLHSTSRHQSRSLGHIRLKDLPASEETLAEQVGLARDMPTTPASFVSMHNDLEQQVRPTGNNGLLGQLEPVREIDADVSMLDSHWEDGLNFDFVPNIFAFDEAGGGLISDQDTFFQWLEVPNG